MSLAGGMRSRRPNQGLQSCFPRAASFACASVIAVNWDASRLRVLDAGGADRLPPSEEPFLLGRKPYYLITLVKRRVV